MPRRGDGLDAGCDDLVAVNRPNIAVRDPLRHRVGRRTGRPDLGSLHEGRGAEPARLAAMVEVEVGEDERSNVLQVHTAPGQRTLEVNRPGA